MSLARVETMLEADGAGEIELTNTGPSYALSGLLFEDENMVAAKRVYTE